MANRGTLENYSLDEQMALMKEAEELERENEKKQAVYQSQLTSLSNELRSALQDPNAQRLGLNIDIDRMSDKEYVLTQIEYIKKLFAAKDTSYREEISKVLTAYRGVESQRGV